MAFVVVVENKEVYAIYSRDFRSSLLIVDRNKNKKIEESTKRKIRYKVICMDICVTLICIRKKT
jgi:hypothetical protein